MGILTCKLIDSLRSLINLGETIQKVKFLRFYEKSHRDYFCDTGNYLLV